MSLALRSSFGGLEWRNEFGAELPGYEEAAIGDFPAGDGVRFTLQFMSTNYRRGKWRLLIEVASEHQDRWGCFDEGDQPMRYYHYEETAKREARAIAEILLADRQKFRRQ
jgi:hypothetical protein